ncbi:MAG: hypothetical protein Q9160_005006 [Pyrenula sp. 1 TL-2023]
MSIKAIFYSKFDTQEGPKVIHQVPEDSIIPNTSSNATTFVNFPDISFFVIPRQELCGNLIQVCKEGYRILSYPICIKSPYYDRNEFIFNFCLVLAEDEPFSSYKTVVKKLATLMRGLEEQSHFLSADLSQPNTGKVYSLCEVLMEDLNNYCECMIPIDSLNTLNIKLFPTYAPPPPVKAWHVPLFTIRPETLMDENWDLTMQRILPYINGVSSVKKIAYLADADYSLTKRCIKHLLYYNTLLLLDIFSFTAIYAPTAEFGRTIAYDPPMQRECARYVNTAFAPAPPAAASSTAGSFSTTNNPNAPDPDHPSSTSDPHHHHPDLLTTSTIWPLTSSHTPLSGVSLIELYASLRQGQSVREWYSAHTDELAHIDVRRFITFGVIKGFLYRVHKYAFATGHARPSRYAVGVVAAGNGLGGNLDVASAAAASSVALGRSMSSEFGEFSEEDEEDGDEGEEEFEGVDGEDGEEAAVRPGDGIDDEVLGRYLDGQCCFDQICTELEIGEKDLLARIKRWPGEVQIIHR